MHAKSSVLPPRIVLSKATVYATQGDIYALDAKDGTLIQHYQIQGIAAPTVVDDIIYVSVNHLFEHTIQALRIIDGSSIWRFQVEGNLSSVPSVIEDTVYISHGDTVSALDAHDGSALWHYSTGPVHLTSPTVVNEVAYISPSATSLSSPSVYALRTRDGTLLWQSQIPESATFPLAVTDGVVYINTYSKCFALQASDGFFLWQYETGSHIGSSPIVVDEIVYITLLPFTQDVSFLASGQTKQQPKAFVCALQANDGSLLWQRGVGNGLGISNPTASVVTRDAIYIGTDNGFLYAFHVNVGTLLWHYKTGGTLLSSPIESNGVVYIGANDGYVYALRASNGDLLWQTFVSIAVTAKSSVNIRR